MAVASGSFHWLSLEPSSPVRGPGSPCLQPTAMLGWSARCLIINLAYNAPGGAPLWAIALKPLPRLLGGPERLQCIHLLATTLRQGPTYLQRLQRRWRSFWRLSRNKLRWQGPHAPSLPSTPNTLLPMLAIRGRSKYLMPSLILHQQPLIPQAR